MKGIDDRRNPLHRRNHKTTDDGGPFISADAGPTRDAIPRSRVADGSVPEGRAA